MKRALVLAALWASVTGGLAALAGCYGNICDPSFVRYGRAAGEGRLLDEDTWESNPVEGTWLAFPRQRVYEFDLSALGDRTPQLIVPYISAEPNGASHTIGAGNLAELSSVTRARATVKNGTCADYYLRLVAVAPPRAPTPTAPTAPTTTPPADAGTEGGTP